MSATSNHNTIRAHWRSFAACSLITLCPFQYGIDFGVIGGLQAMPGFLAVYGHKDPTSPIGYNISPIRQQLISSLMILGAFLSSGFAGPTAVYLGRRHCIWLATLCCAVSNIIMMTTENIGVLYFARFLIGCSNGLFFTVSQLYIQEVAPVQFRGLFINLMQFWNTLGTLLGAIIDNFSVHLEGKQAYIIPLGTIFIIPGILAIGLFFIPESPRWLLQQGQTDRARRGLERLRPSSHDVNGEVNEISSEIRSQQELAGKSMIMDMIRGDVDRRRLLLSIGAVTLQSASGAFYMLSYATYFFAMAHVGSPFENTCILTSVGVASTIINNFVITKWGKRRVALVLGMALCGLTQLIIAVVYDNRPGTVTTGKVIVGITVVYILCFNGMVAPYAWLCGGELPSQRLRSGSLGIAAALSFFFAWLSAFTAPYFINPESLGWGPKYGYIWAGSCFVASIWAWLFLPETHNRSFDDIDQMFQSRLSAREFRKYRSTGSIIGVTTAPEGHEKDEAFNNVEHIERKV